ncbi:MAG: hypothetical protein Q4A15_10505 [Prevotellaceae bacterium]|nr:hypothetical protein [Prevotellaceae bacterium]
MKTYRVKTCFGLEYEHITVFFNVNTRWRNIGERNGYIRLNRDNVFVDVTREQIRKFMVELKEQI